MAAHNKTLHGVSLPLEGVRVADFSRVLAGPYCSMLLADLGAEVIKVEHPAGDETRGWGPPYAEGAGGVRESAYYLAVNRNKRALRLDLKDPRERELAYRLIERSDVLLHNFKHGDDVRLGLDYESVTRRNPTLVYAAISGFGSSGPEADKPGYDLLAQAVTGLMSITGPEPGEPSKVGVALIDVLAGLNAALGIVAGLYAQRREPRARRVETSLLEAGLSALVNVASAYLITGEAPRRYGNAHPSIVPYQQFRSQDAPLVVAAANDRQFRTLAEVLGRPEWAEDPRFATNPARVENRHLLVPLLQAVFAQRPRAEWLAALEAAGVPCAPVNTLPEVFASPQVAARQMVLDAAHPDLPGLKLVANGLKLDGAPTPVYRHPPRLGEHDAELRAWLEADDTDERRAPPPGETREG